MICFMWNVTLKPKTEAGQVLLAIAKTITTSTQELFAERCRNFHINYASFLVEKTFHPDGSWSYTHEGVHHAYVALIHWYPYLFTCHGDRSIPNTTNTCDGHFSHIKDILRIHRGLCKPFKQKYLTEALHFGRQFRDNTQKRRLFSPLILILERLSIPEILRQEPSA